MKMKFDDLDIQWTQKSNELILKCVYGSYFFRMPHTWELEKVSKNLLRLAEILIFLPFVKENMMQLIHSTNWEQRSSKGKIGLSFSGGIDSAAAAILLPKEETVLCYLKRDGLKSSLCHENQIRCLDWFKDQGYEGYVIETNIELIRNNLKDSDGKQRMVGFPTDYVCALPIYLLADHLGLSYVTTGTVLDSTFLLGGYKYRDFTKSSHYIGYDALFKSAGLPIFWTVGGCTEIVTSIICEKNGIPAQSCLRRDEGECGKCYKCFRKNAYRGGAVNLSKEVEKILAKKPLKMGASMIFISQKRNINEVKSMYPDVKVDFENGYYSEAYRGALNLPVEYRDKILDNIEKNVEPMTEKEVEMLKMFDILPHRRTQK